MNMIKYNHNNCIFLTETFPLTTACNDTMVLIFPCTGYTKNGYFTMNGLQYISSQKNSP